MGEFHPPPLPLLTGATRPANEIFGWIYEDKVKKINFTRVYCKYLTTYTGSSSILMVFTVLQGILPIVWTRKRRFYDKLATKSYSQQMFWDY